MNDPAVPYKAKIQQIRSVHFSQSTRHHGPLATLHAYCRDVDKVIQDIYRKIIEPKEPDHAFCLVALGGYGRRELWPFSDIDILIIHRDKHKSAKLSSAVKMFWNIGLTMGCVVRTIDECAAILGEDLATDTALLESRYICGNRELFLKLRHTCIEPYFAKNKKSYIEEISTAVRNGLYSSENSLYRVEPDIKNGICTLRDCQRLLWAERVRSNVRTFEHLHTRSGFSETETRRFEANYAWLAGLRNELHLLSGQRLDILEKDYQNPIAIRLGFGPGGAGMLMEAFYKTVRSIRLSLLSFLEKDLSGKSRWGNVRQRLSATSVAPGMILLDGIIFSQQKKDVKLNSALSIMLIYKSLLNYQATLSVELQNKIRRSLPSIHAEEFKTEAVGSVFLEILSWPGPVGQILLMMHETGVLAKLIPPFDVLTCKVEYDPYHEFTIDQHILLAICACDELANDPDDKIRHIYQSINNKLILRLAVLLHDVGKSQEGDHTQNGAVMAEIFCERLGLTENQTGQVRLLVYHHLDMSDMSFLREPDDRNIEDFAGTVGDQNNLSLLYILTIADIRSVGHHAWTGWKSFQLEELYERVLQFFKHQKKQEYTFNPQDPLSINELSYLRDILPEEREKHSRWLSELEESGFQLHHKLFTGFERLTVCDYDRVGFLSDFIGCVTSEGYNILSARIYSTADGKILDIFHLETPDKPRIASPKRINNINLKWNSIKSGCVSADDLVKERLKIYPPVSLRIADQKQNIEVHINNIDSPNASIIEIDTPDNFGLLHKIVRCFYENEINVVSAKLSTRNDRAVDVFYVTDTKKQKILQEAYMNKIISSVKATLAR